MTTNTTSRTAGAAFGSTIGATAAHLVHFAALSGTGLGRFASDTAGGVATGYAATSATRSAERYARAAARKALAMPTTPIGVLITA